MPSPRASKPLAVLATVVLAVVVAFVAMNLSAASGPSEQAGSAGSETAGTEADGSTGSARSAARPSGERSAEREPKALVEEMIDGLKSGKKVASFDSPTAGAVVPIAESPGNAPVGRLNIPRMGLGTPFREGVHDSIIDLSPGHWPGTPLPGQAGNAVLSGHRATHGAEFVDLDLLQPGDAINVQVGGRNQRVTYTVQGTTIVPEERYVDVVTRQPKDPDERVLTLFACNPKWDHTQRIVVRAEAKPANPAKGG